jgi:hemerythrin
MAEKLQEIVTWSSALSCGVKIIDDQHKGLVDLVNEMFNHVTGNQEQELIYFNKVIQEAVNYIKVHFATEEKLMIAAKFPGYTEHKKAHDSFVFTVVANIKDYQAGNQITLSSFTNYLKDWVLSHIAVMDKVYFEHFKKIATREEDGTLSITAADIA